MLGDAPPTMTDFPGAEHHAAGASTIESLRQSLEHSPAIGWVKDPDGRYLYVNERYRHELGTSEERLRGRSDAELSPRETVDGPRMRFAADGVQEPVQLEYTVPAFEGRPPLVALRFELHDDSGRPVGMCGIAAPLGEAQLARDEAMRLMQSNGEQLESPQSEGGQPATDEAQPAVATNEFQSAEIQSHAYHQPEPSHQPEPYDQPDPYHPPEPSHQPEYRDPEPLHQPDPDFEENQRLHSDQLQRDLEQAYARARQAEAELDQTREQLEAARTQAQAARTQAQEARAEVHGLLAQALAVYDCPDANR